MPSWPALDIIFPGEGAGRAPGEPPLQDRVSLALDGLDIVAIVEASDDRWQVFFRHAPERASAAAALEDACGPGVLALRAVDVDDEDWARRSQASLRAVRVGRILVAPPWDAAAPADEPDVITILIEPAMGFGSGHHATTRLCLRALQRLDVQGRRLLDVGTGSGVLALAAARLGAARVLAIDVDPDALRNARDNAAMNGMAAQVVFRQQDFRDGAVPAADIVVANLTGGMLVAGVPQLARAVAPGGALILSGITTGERDAVLRACADGFAIEWSEEEEGWCAALLAPIGDARRRQ
jgi:ribosomal protein L11 methyltransferase